MIVRVGKRVDNVYRRGVYLLNQSKPKSPMILVTGGTGFLGREIVGRLLHSRPSERIGLLVRPAPGVTAEDRVLRLLGELFGADDAARHAERVEVIAGDVAEEDFGIGSGAFKELASRTAEIYHSAATTALNEEISVAQRINIGGTEQILRLAKSAPTVKLNHISTAYVAGNTSAIVEPSALDLSRPFRNAYERTKAEAEALVRDASSELNICIFRPSIIVGDSVTGETSAFNVIYIPAKLIVKGFFLRFPALPHIPFDVVPVDYVADAIVYLSGLEHQSGTCYHLSAGLGRESSPWEILEQLIGTFNKYRRRGRSRLLMPTLVPPEVMTLAHSSFSAAMKVLERMVCERLNVFRQTVPFIPYMLDNPRFDTTLTERALGGARPPLFANYAELLFRYCLETDWGKKPWTNPANLPAWQHRSTLRAA